MCLEIAVNNPQRVLAKGHHRGFQWIVLSNMYGYRCGYVRVPEGHPWHGVDYKKIECRVHGGLSFSEADVPCDEPEQDGKPGWWVGFDCAHGNDAPDPALMQLVAGFAPDYTKLEELLAVFSAGRGNCNRVVRSQGFVEAQCRHICKQAEVVAWGLALT